MKVLYFWQNSYHFSSTLTRLDIRYNKIKDEGKEALRKAKEKTSLKHLLLDKVEGFQVNA